MKYILSRLLLKLKIVNYKDTYSIIFSFTHKERPVFIVWGADVLFHFKLILRKAAVFLLGAACFTISQPLLRLPILQSLQKSTGFTLAYMLNPLLIGILIALSAGVFEEGFRFIFKQFLIKPNECNISQPIVFGLGHGIAEALIILVPVLASVPIAQLGLAFLERGLAVILHVTLTVIVWNGFQKKQRALYLLIAILIHGFADALIPVFASIPNSVLLLEGAFALIDVMLIVYTIYSKKYYIRRS